MRWGRVVAAAAVLGLAGAGCTGGAPPPERAPATTAASAAGRPAWRALAVAPTERTEVAAAAVGDRVWVLGGYAADGATLATVEVYDTGADTWVRGPDLPVAVNHAMAATLDGVLYVAGGNDGTRPSSQLARLDGDRWRTLAPLPQGRSAGGLAALAGRLYLVGGGVEGGLAADTQVYDPAADAWSSAPGPPTPREHLGAAASAGKLYVVGGRVGGVGHNLAAAEAFDPGSGRWSSVAELPTPRGGLAATATAGGQVVAVGGEAAVTFSEAEAFDPDRGRWRSLPPLPTPRHGLGVVAVADVVYVLAGGPRPGLHTSAANEAIDLGE